MALFPNTLSVIHNNPADLGGIDRELSDYWTQKQTVANIDLSELTATMIKNRSARIAEGLHNENVLLSRLLYADTIKWCDRSLSYRMKWHVTRAASRVRDAWLVLTGQADIGDDY